MKFSDNGLNLLKKLEGERLKAYLDSVGVLTIGYGHTGLVDGKKIYLGMTISKEKAEELLVNDCQRFIRACNELIKVNVSQETFDAMVIFSFNVGIGTFQKSSVLRYLNQGRTLNDVANRLALYKFGTVNGQKVPIKGLENRRNSEIHLLLNGEYGHV